MAALSLRSKGVCFIMAMLAFAQMAYSVLHDTPVGGGTDGTCLDVTPVLAIGGTTLMGLDKAGAFPAFTPGLLVLMFGFIALLLRSRYGRAPVGIKANEQRILARDFSTYPFKLAACMISGGLAGLLGFLFAVKDWVVNPELLSWHLSGAVLIVIILGGLRHLRGAQGAGPFAIGVQQRGRQRGSP